MNTAMSLPLKQRAESSLTNDQIISQGHLFLQGLTQLVGSGSLLTAV